MNTLGIQWIGEMKFKFMVRRRMLILSGYTRHLWHLKEVFVRDPSNRVLLRMYYLLLATHFNYKMLGFRADRAYTLYHTTSTLKVVFNERSRVQSDRNIENDIKNTCYRPTLKRRFHYNCIYGT